MKRKEIDVCLAIVLLFTGIGIIIYLIYYFMQEEVRCVHCNSICKPLDYKSQDPQQLEYQEPVHEYSPPQNSNMSNTMQHHEQEVEVVGNTPKFCPFCGSKLDNRDQKFCANCGNNLQ